MMRTALHKIELFLWPLDQPERLPIWASYLSEDEAIRAARFVRPRDASAFIAARGKLREVLSGVLGEEPDAISFAYGEHGRPYLQDTPELCFSLSHSGGFAALAVAQDLTFGLDIEAPRPIEYEVAAHFFSAAEQAELAALPPGAWQSGFYNAWTRKEAVIKAEGLGLFMPLTSFDVSLTPGEPAVLSRIAGGAAQDWSLHHLLPGPHLTGALAVRQQAAKLRIIPREGWPQ